MTSTQFKNAGTPAGLFRALLRRQFMLPPEDDDAIATAQNTTGIHSTTAATYTDATRTLTKTGFFAGYQFKLGDQITSVTGTGITASVATISRKVDANSVILVEDIGADASDVAFSLADGVIRLDGAMVKPLNEANTKVILPYPASPLFTFSQATDAGIIRVSGINQFGDPITTLITKTGSGTVLKTVATSSLARIPCFQSIDRVEINFTAATGTVKMGFNYSSGTSNNIPLPAKFTAISAVRGVWVDSSDGLWGTASLINGMKQGALVTHSSGTDLDAVAGVLSITTGITGAHAAVNATYTDATKTLTKTGFFASYTQQAGDTIVVTDGGSAKVTSGTYHIAHKVDSDSVILVEDIGADASDVSISVTRNPTLWTRGFIYLDPAVMQD